MDASVAEVVTESTRSRLQIKMSKTKEKKVFNTVLHSVPLHRKKKPHNWHPKSSSCSSFKSTSSVAVAQEDNYQDTVWFKAGNGDLFFAQWFLNRCNGVGDFKTPQSDAATQRVFMLYKAQCKLRRELALGSKRDEERSDKAIDEEEEDQEELVNDIEEPLWDVEEIVKHVGDVLRISRQKLMEQKRLAEMTNMKVEGTIERIVVAEVVENATELILSRATSDQEMQLRRWISILKEDEIIDKVTTNVGLETGGDDRIDVNKKKKMRSKKSKVKVAEDTACKQVASFLVFLEESAKAQTLAQTSAIVPPIEMAVAWMAELQRLVELSSIEPEEEERRRQVALDIQTILRREVTKWRHCEVVLFGSSLTHFGSRDSDLDMCLFPNTQNVDTHTTPSTEKRQLQHLVDENVCVRAPSFDTEKVEHLQDLYAQIQKSIKKLTQSLNTLDRSIKNGDKQMKQRRHLEFFYTQMRLLRNAIVAQLTQLDSSVEPHNHVNTNGKSARLKTLIDASRRSSEDLYLLRATLQHAAKCVVHHVIAGARVPIIRFLHTRSGREYDCDLCFKNVLASRNTSLLRAYAAFDDRARIVGFAVKHWAKQRNISEASMGFLSSYSFVLLSIYYLQLARVLPNLQDPQLLESANISPEYYNDTNIAFCEDRDIAQAFHKRTTGKNSSDVLFTTLLTGFFEFYATQFDFAQRVVTVRSPEVVALKVAQWGICKAKTWRMSIQDPLETGRDLGCVLQFERQKKILCELRRAHELLAQGESFIDKVCAVENAGDDAGKVKRREEEAPMSREVTMRSNSQPNKEQIAETRHQEEKKQRSYVVILQSADKELTEEAINTLFRSFQKSFRVSDVTEVAQSDCAAVGNENKRWMVELLTQTLDCPHALSQRTRIDWKAADGRVGRVWVHHQALFNTPPCRKCLSPGHATGKCLQDKDNNEGGGSRRKNRKNVQRHVLRLTLSENRSSKFAKKSSRRCKHEQQHAAVHDTDHSKNKSVKRNNSSKSSRRAKERFHKREIYAGAMETNVRHVEIAKSVEVSFPARVEAKIDASAKVTSKKKKWRQGGSSKKALPKEDKASAATNAT